LRRYFAILARTPFSPRSRPPEKLLLASDNFRGRRIDVAYSAFDFVNKDADVVIVGVTPGRQQMRNALLEAQRCLKFGMSEMEAMKAAKVFASFSGPMRSNLVGMLDAVGVARTLGVSSTASLWNTDAHRVHFTSALRYLVFVDGGNYSGAPSMLSVPVLQSQLKRWFTAEMIALPNAVFIPLGPNVAGAIETVAGDVGLSTNRILSGLPHPSGANAEGSRSSSAGNSARSFLARSPLNACWRRGRQWMPRSRPGFETDSRPTTKATRVSIWQARRRPRPPPACRRDLRLHRPFAEGRLARGNVECWYSLARRNVE
jgi:hypothetical protein